ncbi:hypothetical protein WJS89_08130 [Sphingomicrobium sp. XHP0235]|uniref:hypothetical protein n=1 Tax=Sphingomicrobium aquimarinum TaxID=3133971 RepID=UPI0031FE6E1E
MSDGTKLMLAALLGWAGCLAGLVISDAIQLRHVLMAPSIALLVAALLATLFYLLLSRWIGTSWVRLFLPLFVAMIALGLLSGKILWKGAPPGAWETLLVYSFGAAFGAATGFWAGLILTRFEPSGLR